MNCSQARELLSTYRESKKGTTDTTPLDVHLATCDDCRKALDQYTFVGERIRLLPSVESSPEAYTKLMRALATEQSRFIQRSSSHTPTPDFLKPYLQEQTQKELHTDALAAFSTAETGPLPILRPTHKRSQSFHMSHFAILGVAAMLLLVMMTGGVTSLLLLNKTNPSSHLTTGANKNSTTVYQPSQVTMSTLGTTTSYPHVVSAVGDRQYIYYTAYGNTDADWMLEQLDNKTKVSTPLLQNASANPLVVLGSSKDWLVWLQLDSPQLIKSKKKLPNEAETFVRPWTVYALSLTKDPGTLSSDVRTPTTLLQGTFDQKAIPNWIHSPIQGLWFVQNTLLLSSLDKKGTSHLDQYSLETNNDTNKTGKSAVTEIATANSGRILTSPTANSDGTSIYWGEEWLDNDNTLHSKIWTQQTTEAAPQRGTWVNHVQTNTFQFSSDETSFHPQVVNDTLFFLNTDTGTTPDATGTQINAQVTPTVQATTAATPRATAQSTASATATASATPQVSGGTNTTITRIDSSVYTPQIDATIQGTLVAYSVQNDAKIQPPLDTNGPVSELQAGGRFLIWQDSNNSFNMFDVGANIPVTIDPTMVPKDASFLAVNGDTAVWLTNTDTTPDTNDPANSTVLFKTFNWPPPITSSIKPKH